MDQHSKTNMQFILGDLEGKLEGCQPAPKSAGRPSQMVKRAVVRLSQRGAMKACRKCHQKFAPSEHELKHGDYMCPTCRHDWMDAWRNRRRALGIPVNRRGSVSPEWMSKYFKKYRLRPEVKIKNQARDIANRAVKKGILMKLPCSRCGAENSQKHHPDYSKPLMIVWLCRPCHLAVHAAAQGSK